MATARAVPPQKPADLPLLVYFQQESKIQQLLDPCKRQLRTEISEALRMSPALEWVVVTSSEKLVAEHAGTLRRPSVRVLAICDQPFHDPRADGVVYAYLPVQTSAVLLERMIENALDHIHLHQSRKVGNERLAGVTREIQELNRIGAALSAEHDTGKLLELILTKSRAITASDAGSLYLVEAAEEPPSHPSLVPALGSGPEAPALVRRGGEEHLKKRLRFKLAQNDSVNIPFREASMEINDKSIAGYVALTGEIVNLEDAYNLPPEFPFSINRKFDEDSGYRTRSILAVPLRNQKDDIVGVLQLINAKRDPEAKLDSVAQVMDQVVPFGQRQMDIVESLASQAAVALENSRLYEAIQRLFEGFVRASVIAIEARDPTTSGHSFRVANLTVGLAEAIDRVDSGPYAAVKFARNEMKEIRYASLLHDFGKVGVREEVLVKAKKLYPLQIDLIQQRFAFAKQELMRRQGEKRLACVLGKGHEAYLGGAAEFDSELAQQLHDLDEQLEVVLKSNEPTVLAEGNFERLLDIARQNYCDLEGREHPLLTEDEIRLLSIRKGSLDDEERLQIESHVVHTFKFLQQIPWTSEIRNIPEIARGHHEKLNGKGYPYKLSAREIPLQTRIMTISDIFDALCAADRPYKRAVSLDRALEILGYAVKDGEIDGQLFQLFLDAKVYERWKVEPYPY